MRFDNVLVDWSEDQIGQLIEPAPIDWAAWRKTNMPPTVPLSRRDRRAAEARGRK
jgi:hypothetical protein